MLDAEGLLQRKTVFLFLFATVAAGNATIAGLEVSTDAELLQLGRKFHEMAGVIDWVIENTWQGETTMTS